MDEGSWYYDVPSIADDVCELWRSLLNLGPVGQPIGSKNLE